MVYQRKFDPSLFLIPKRENYPLPAYKGLLAQPSWQPVTGVPPSLLNNAPPPVDTMGGLMGEVGGADDPGLGAGPDNAGVQTDPGYTAEELGMKGRMTNTRTMGFGPTEQALASLATNAVSQAVPGAGTVLGAYNGISNINNTMVNNKALTEIGMPLTAAQQLGGFFGLNGYNGNMTDALNAAMQTQRGRNALSVGMPSTEEINADIYSQQPDFQYDRPEKYSIEVQSLDDPAGNAGGGRGNDGWGDENDSGYGDDMGGPDGGLRHGGLLGDDGDGKFEPVRKTLHENEAVLKPEAVGLLGDDVVTQLNNVASLNDEQKKVLVAGLLDAIIGGKSPKKKTDFKG